MRSRTPWASAPSRKKKRAAGRGGPVIMFTRMRNPAVPFGTVGRWPPPPPPPPPPRAAPSETCPRCLPLPRPRPYPKKTRGVAVQAALAAAAPRSPPPTTPPPPSPSPPTPAPPPPEAFRPGHSSTDSQRCPSHSVLALPAVPTGDLARRCTPLRCLRQAQCLSLPHTYLPHLSSPSPTTYTHLPTSTAPPHRAHPTRRRHPTRASPNRLTDCPLPPVAPIRNRLHPTRSLTARPHPTPYRGTHGDRSIATVPVPPRPQHPPLPSPF